MGTLHSCEKHFQKNSSKMDTNHYVTKWTQLYKKSGVRMWANVTKKDQEEIYQSVNKAYLWTHRKIN